MVTLFIIIFTLMNTLLLLVAKSTTSNQFLWVKTSQTIGNTINTADKTAWFLVNNPFVSKLLSVLLAIVVAWFLIRLSRIIANFISSKIKRGFNDKDPDSVNKIAQLSGDLIFYAMATFSVYLWFKIVWIDIWLIVWWLSIGIWFATKEIISNLIAGIFIFSTKDYKIGDIIEIQDKQMPWWGIFGKIDEITIRYIIIKTFDLRRIVIPNIQFMQSKVKTYTSEDIIRMDFPVVVSMSSDIDKTIQMLKDELNTLDFLTHKELTDILIDWYDDKKVTLRCFFTFDPNGSVPWHIARSQAEYKTLKLLKKHAFAIE